VSPFFDFELKNPTVDGNGETDKLLSRPLLEFFRDCWLGGTGVGYDDPGVNPLYADLAGLPPVSVYYGEHELLAGEAIEFAQSAKGAALDVTVHPIPDGQHSFILGRPCAGGRPGDPGDGPVATIQAGTSRPPWMPKHRECMGTRGSTSLATGGESKLWRTLGAKILSLRLSRNPER
jgi:acetyl esterase/lipase